MSDTIKCITLGDLAAQINKFKRNNPSIDLKKVPVFLGDDEELNGIHEAFLFEAGDWTSEYDTLLHYPSRDMSGPFVLIS